MCNGKYVTKTRLCNIQRLFLAVRIKNYLEKENDINELVHEKTGNLVSDQV